jgi:hypothetical protein
MTRGRAKSREQDWRITQHLALYYTDPVLPKNLRLITIRPASSVLRQLPVGDESADDGPETCYQDPY